MGTTMRVTFEGWDPTEHAAWAARVAAHRMLEDVVDDGLEIVDLVIQDEFTHDILVPVGPTVWLVYDST